jgi:molybdenum cofactor cytidylyltransferase
MQFGAVPLDQAVGAVLAHATGPLKKGTALGADQIERLRGLGVDQVIVARLDGGDMAEDAAAMTIAWALVPDPAEQGLYLGGAATGRVNLYASGPGVLQMDVPAIHALNAVHPMITVATLAPLARVIEGAMVATVKIISYAVPKVAVDQAAGCGRGGICLVRPRFDAATLIETSTDGTTPPGKGRDAMRLRLSRLGLGLSERVVVPHQAMAVAKAIGEAAGQIVLILTASATSDPRDVGPEGLRLAGGVVTRFGMPVDPGNLLFFGNLGAKPVIGLPGCARSPALNGADWVLERLICGIEVTGQDIAAMGVGGLLKEIPSRPRPRDLR